MPFQDSTNLNNVSKYIVDATGDTPYTTIQSAIDAANTAGGNATVFVRNGTYTEDLTLYSTINVVGATGLGDLGDCIIIGEHTPPAAGRFVFRNFLLQDANNIFNSAVAGTSDLVIIDCLVNVTNGYTFNLLNWTGTFVGFDIGETSTNDGFVNNTGGATVFMTNITMGVGAVNTMVVSGNCELYNVHCQCPITFQGAGTTTINGGCWFSNTITTAATATVSIVNSLIDTGANQAITHGSANELSLSDVTIDTSNNPSIGGAGAGNLQVGTITFLDNADLAGTLTLDRTPTLATGVAQTTVIEAIGEGAGAQNVIDITPAAAIGGVAWRGIDIDGAALDPTAANSTVYGLSTDLSGVAQTNDPDLRGISITMPVAPGQGCDSSLHTTGYGMTSMINCSQRMAGFYTDSVIEQDADITAFTAVDSGFSHEVNVDNLGSTGGDFHALEVSVTGAGTAAVVAVSTNPEVEVIHQHTGVFAATAQSWKENGGFTDVTAAFDNPGVDVTIFDGDNDYIYIGTNAAFSQIRVILNTVSGRDIFPVFEYSTVGPVWVPFTPIDGTNGFIQDGIISFDSGNLAAWAAVVVNGANHFYIRIQRTRNNIVTTPIEDTIRVLEPVEYSWNEDGDILAASVTAAGLADTSGTQYEILTFGAGGILNGIGPLTDGQLIIGDTGATAVAATLASAGGTVAITNGAGTINLEAPGGALAWSVEAGAAVAAAINSGYISNRGGGVTYTIPTTAAVGSIIRICSILGLSTIAQNAAESIVFGAFTTTVGVGGSLVATNVGDAIEIVCTVADTTWSVLSSVGNWTVN